MKTTRSMVPRASLVLACAAIVVTGCTPSDPTRGLAAGANVLIISLDTVRADRLGGYGYEAAQTPTIDQFLAESVVFEEALAVRALTEPSLTSMLTGLYPYEHELVANGYQIRNPIPPNLVDTFKAAGYEANIVAANGCKAMRQFDWDHMRCTKTRDDRAVAAALHQLRRKHDGPRFLWVHLFAAHSPYGGRKHARSLYPDYEGPADGGNLVLRELSRSRQATEEDLAFVNARYDGGVQRADRNVHQILEQARESWPDAVMVLTSDHGEELGDHDKYLFHACSTYRAGLRVPLAVHAPGLEPRRVRRLVETRDLAATLTALAGIDSEVVGSNLLSTDTEAPAFSGFDTYPIWTVQNRGWRLVANPEEAQPRCYPKAEPGAVTIDQTELYRLADDPGEQHNVAAEFPDQVSTMTELLESWPGYGRPSQRQDLDEKTRKELEALGYVN